MGKIFIAAVVLVVYTFLFKKASGDLKIKNLNIISFTFYSILVFELLGSSLIYIGFREHYLIQAVRDISSIDKTYYILCYTILMLPISIIFFNRLIITRNVKKSYTFYKDKPVVSEHHENFVFILLLFLSLIGFLATIYTLSFIGYLPIIKMFTGGVDFNRERIIIGHGFQGDQYVRNILMSFLVPLLSYIVFIYMRVSKKIKWIILFLFLFILSIIVKTYDFSKGPVIYYLFYFVCIEILLGNIKHMSQFFPYIGLGVGIVLFFYIIMLKEKSSLFSIYTGPIGRIVFSQVATLFLHVDAYPSQLPYLYGHSFSNKFNFLFGPGDYGIRSGRQVMELYGASAVQQGTAGVMNSIFTGEAYANWGILGVIAAPIIVGFILSVIYATLLKLPKTPINIALYMQLFILFSNELQGGFVDFFYNAFVIVTILLMLSLKYFIRCTWR